MNGYLTRIFKLSSMKRITSFLSAIFFVSNLIAQSDLTVPYSNYYIIDQTSLLNQNEYTLLESKLKAFKEHSGNVLFVMIINSCDGLSIEEYADKLFNNWKLGENEKNNGIFLLIASGDQNARIKIGKGIKSFISDTESESFINDIIVPHFKQGACYEGLEISTNYIINELKTGFDFSKYTLKKRKGISKYNFSISPSANRKNSINPIVVSVILYLTQLFLLIALSRFLSKKYFIKKTNYLITTGVVINFLLAILFILLNYNLESGITFYDQINLYCLCGFVFACFSYLFVLLPGNEIFNELIRFLIFSIYAFLLSLPIFYFVVELFDLNTSMPFFVSYIMILIILHFCDKDGTLSYRWWWKRLYIR